MGVRGAPGTQPQPRCTRGLDALQEPRVGRYSSLDAVLPLPAGATASVLLPARATASVLLPAWAMASVLLPAWASPIQALPTNLFRCNVLAADPWWGNVCPWHVLAKSVYYIRPQHHYSGITFAICFTKLILDTIIRGNHPHNTLSTRSLKWSNFRPLEKWIHRTCLWMARKGHLK